MTMPIEFHPIANAFPLMQGREFDALVADIKDRGLNHAIIIHEHKILDGRNRWRACAAAGVPIRTEDFAGKPEDAVKFVISENLRRRHLDESGRAMVAARLATYGHGGNRKSPIGDLPGITQGGAAEMLNVGKRSVERAAVVLESGDAELIGDVEQGKISVSSAAARIEAKRRRAEIAEQAKVPESGERYRLVKGGVDKLLLEPAGSIDLIVTDPPYPEEYLPLFGELARGAAHALKPGGLLICMSGKTWLPRVFAELDSTELQYLWTMCYHTPGAHAHVFPRKVNTGWKPVIIYCQGAYEGERYGDVVKSDAPDKEHHHWGQSVSGMRDLMRRFVMPGHVIVDPFLGGGTTAIVALELGATFIGFDIDEDAIDATRARLAISTQPTAEPCA